MRVILLTAPRWVLSLLNGAAFGIAVALYVGVSEGSWPAGLAAGAFGGAV